MQVEINKATSKKISEVSKSLGIKKSDIVNRALLVYLDNLDKYVSLQQEMRDWDILSDDALSNFEKSL
jgi:hypothetical protein